MRFLHAGLLSLFCLLLSAAPEGVSAQKAAIPSYAPPPSRLEPLPPFPVPDAKLNLPPPPETACTSERKAKSECQDTAGAPLMGSPTTPPPMFGRGPGKL